MSYLYSMKFSATNMNELHSGHECTHRTHCTRSVVYIALVWCKVLLYNLCTY